MALVPNGLPHLELSINQKMVENALNRFLTSVQVTNDIEFNVVNLRFLARSGEDPLNAVHVRFNLGIAGAALDDWAELKLYLDGPRREKVRVDFVDRKKDCWFDVITELKWGLVLVDLLKPVILELPTDLDGRQVQYYLKAEEGNLILAATYTGLNTLFNEALFHVQYRGCASEDDRFGFAVNHRVIKQTLVEAINSFEPGDIRLHDISEGDISFEEDKMKIRGGFTSDAPCGPGSVDLDLNYDVEAEFTNNKGNIDVIVSFHVDFADFGERFQATVCGILEAVESRRLYLPFLTLVFDVATIVGLFMAEAEANRVADQQIDLYDYRTTGIGFWKEGDRRWRVMVRPVAALKEWGGLLWPMRITRIDLDAGGRVLVTGNQDVDPDDAGDQEADFRGGFETKWHRRHEIKYNLVGSPEGFNEAVFRLVKNDDALYAVVGWEIVDDTHRCFSVSAPPSILSGSGLPVGDIQVGSMVLSPQNEIRVRVRFGPDFYRYLDQGEGEGYWAKYAPGPGASFLAKLKVTYVSKDEAGRWVTGDAYIDLHGVISLSVGMDAPSVSGIHDAFHVMPDEILEIGEELQAGWGIWDDLPGPNDMDYMEVYCHQKAVQEVTVTDARGSTCGRAFAADYKILSLPTDPKQDYVVTSTMSEGERGGRFMVQRLRYEHRHTVTLAEPIHGYAYRNGLLAVSTGATVVLYRVDDADTAVELGRTRFRSDVRHLAPTSFSGSTGFLAADDSTLRIIGAPDEGRRTIVKQERKLSGLSGQGSLNMHEGTVYGASEVGVTVVGRQVKEEPSTTVVKPRTQALNIRAEQTLFAGDWLLARTGDSLQVYKAPWLGGGPLGSISVQPTCEFRVKGWNAYIHDGGGKTTVVSLMNPSEPVAVAEYKESERSWRTRPEGHRAFEVHPSGKSLVIYRRRPRRINMKKLSEATLSRLRV